MNYWVSWTLKFSSKESLIDWLFDLDASAHAYLKQGREVSATLDKDQSYYFRAAAKKEKNGARMKVKFCHCDLHLTLSIHQACYLIHSQRAEQSVTVYAVSITFRTIRRKRLNPGLLPIATVRLAYSTTKTTALRPFDDLLRSDRKPVYGHAVTEALHK